MYVHQPTSVNEEVLANELEDTKRKLLSSKHELKCARKEIVLLKRKVIRLKNKRIEQKVNSKSEKKSYSEQENTDIADITSTFPPVPAALFTILMKNCKKINWYKEDAAMELCLSLFFRSTSAYMVLRASGFILPHPSTFRRRIRTVLKQHGLCPVLLDMMRIRALFLKEHEKLVTLSF